MTRKAISHRAAHGAEKIAEDSVCALSPNVRSDNIPFHKQLDRLRRACVIHDNRGSTVQIARRDLQSLLDEFDRVDALARDLHRKLNPEVY